MSIEIFTFHEDVQNPNDLELIPQIYLDRKVMNGFEIRGCANIFTSKSKPFLYGFTEDNVLWRCDSIYHKQA